MASPLDDLRKPRPSALRGLLAPSDPTAAAESAQLALDNTSSFRRGTTSAAYGMSAGATAQEALTAELENKAAEASALRQQALEQATLAQRNAPAINSYTQVHGVGDALSYAAGAVGQALPTMAPSIAAAAAARFVPGAAGLLGKTALPYAGAYVPAYLQERNEAILNQVQDPVAMQRSAQERQDTARLKGGVNAALEAIVPASLGHGFLRPGSALRTIGNSIVEEGATEGLQEKVGQLAQSHLNPNRDTSQDNQNIIDASLQGAIGGGGISTPTALSQVGANALEASANKAVELGKVGGKKVLEAGQAVSDKTQLPERTNDMMDKLFRAADSVDLDKLKKGVNDATLKGKDLADTIRNMDLREKELPEIAKRVFESIKKKAPEWAAKVDPNNPDSLIAAVKNADWGEKLKTFKRDIGEGFAAGKQFAVDRASKKNLMELDPQMQGDLQQLLFQHLNPDLQDVQSVRDAIPSVATRLAALSARVGDLDKHDVEAMTDLSDTFRSMFPDSEGLASKIKQYVKNTDTSLLDKILSIESATSDARKPGSFLELNLSEKARKAGWDMGQVGKYVDKAVADPDNANYGVLRNLFGSTAKANQVLDYYQSKMAEQGIELDQPEERPLDMSRNGITQVDLGDDTPQYLFADARTMRPFSATAKATVGRGKAQYETSHARKRLADVLNLARKQGNKDLEDSRAHVIGYGEYVAEQGGDPMEHVAQRLEAAQKKRADAETKGKKLKAAGADETELQAEREKIMDANREIKFLKTPGMEPQEILNELYKVVKLTKAKGPQATIDAMRARGMGLDRLVDDEEVHSMGTVLRQRPESEAARNAINATRVTFRTPEGKPVTLSAESIARVMMPRLQPSREGFAQKYQRAFAEGVAALQDQRGWVPEGDLKNVLVHRQGKVKAAGGITNAKDLEPNNSKVAAAARRAEFGVSDHKFATVANARKIEREHAGRPVELFDVAARAYDTIEAELKEAQAELTRARSEFAHALASKKVARLINRLTSAREVAQNAAAKIYPMPERPVTTGIGKDELGDSGLTRLEEMRQDYMDALREYHDNLVELAGDSAVLDFDIARAEDRLNEERRRPEPKQFERDEGEDGQLEGIGRTEPGMGSRTTAIRSNKQRFEAQKKSSPQRAARERAKAEAAPKIEREPKEIPPPMKGGDGPRPDAVKVRGPHESKLPPDNMADVTKDIVPVISPKFGLPAKNLLDTKLNSQTGGAQGNTLNAQEQAALIADLQKQRGPDLKVVFDDFFKVGGSGSYTYDAQTGERTIKIALQAMNPSAVGWHEALHDFFQMLGGDKSSTKMRKEIEAVTSSQPVIRQLRTLLKDHPAALEQIETSAEERAAYAYQFFLQGQIRLGPDTKTLFGKIHAFLARVLHTISTGARVEMALAALYQGHLADPSVASQVMAAIQAQNPTYADRMQAVSNMLGNVSEKLFGSTIERLDNTNVKALGEVGEAFYQPPDKQQDKSLPFLPRRSMARGVWANKVFKILEQYSHDELKAALANLQGMDRTGAIESQVGKLLDDMYDYQVVAGVKRLVRKQDPKTNEWETIEEPLKAIDNYFPRVWDLDSIRKNPQALIDALVQHGGQTQLEAGRIAQALMTHDTVGKTGIDTADTSYVPFNQSTLNREFDFINQSNAKHFAQFQSQDLGDILNTYVDQAVHRAEYARQFGNQGQWLEGKLKEAEAQGATPADLKMARAAIKGMEGTLGLDMSPELRRLQSGIITAENLILLPLALFSQVVDAVAIGARANSFKESLHALDRGFREVVKSFTKHADEFSKDDRLAMDLGIIDETAMLEAMGMTYQGMYMTKRLRNINRKFFRINRMEQWNRAMRVQGMVTGQRFILANKDNPRYMEELGLKASDIRETANGDLAVTELDGLTAAQARKMRTALFKFVDSAVLRPNAAHRPIWGNDPRFMLLIHLKQFSFSFQNVILKNMKKELAFGNAKPAMVLLGAIPLIMMSDLLKNASTGNLDANLTFGQALAHGVARSGLLGTRAFYSDAASDLTHGHMPGVSFLGPTFEHALTITQGILGVPGTDVADVVTRSVPGGALIRNFTQ